jgi:hypothetical protein
MSGKPGRWANINDAIHDGDSKVFVEDLGTGEVNIVVDGTTVQSWLAGGTTFAGTITCDGIQYDASGNADIILSKNTDGEVEILTDNNRSFYADSYWAYIGTADTRVTAYFDSSPPHLLGHVDGSEVFKVTETLFTSNIDMDIGVTGTRKGALALYGDPTGSTEGGVITLHTADDHDTTITEYTVKVVSDNLQIGPSTDPDALEYNGGANKWFVNSAGGLYFDGTPLDCAGLVKFGGATVQNFSIGTGTLAGVLTLKGQITASTAGGKLQLDTADDHDATITDFTIKVTSDDLNIGPSTYPTALQYKGGDDGWEFNKHVYFDTTLSMSGYWTSSISSLRSINSEDPTGGEFSAYGAGTGLATGGRLELYTADDYDTTIEIYTFVVNEDDLLIGPSTDEDSLIYVGGTNDWHFTGAGGINIGVDDSVNASIKLHCTDAPTGDGFYIRTNASGQLEIGNDAQSGMILEASSGPSQWRIFCIDSVEFGVTDTLAGKIELLSGATTQGPEIKMIVPPDFDTTIAQYLIDINEDDLQIGPNTNPDAMKYEGGNNKWVFDAPIDTIAFSLTPTAAEGEGVLRWNATDGTLEVGMPGGDVNLQIGQEQLVRVKNTTGVPILNGKAVYIIDAVAFWPLISLADADSTNSIPEAVVVGVTTEEIAHNATGYITTSGQVRGLDTDHLTEGDPVWLSEVTPGEMTDTKPAAPNRGVFIGHCLKKDAATGVILVGIVPIAPLMGLSDVLSQANTLNGEFLAWNAGTARFEVQDVTVFHDGTDAIIKTDTVAPSDLIITTGAAKTVELTTSVWDDLRAPATGINPPGQVSDPDWDDTRIGWLFDPAGTEMIQVIFQLPHSWKLATNLHPHIHWQPTNTDTGFVRWQLEYEWTNIDGTAAGFTTIVIDDAGDGTDGKHQYIEFTELSGSGKTLSSIISCKVSRLGASDTYTGDALFKEFDMHFEIDTIGSRLELTK